MTTKTKTYRISGTNRRTGRFETANVQGATPGDYIVATAADDGSITGVSVAEPDFAQYRKAVGRVNRLLPDGRCEVAVIIH